MAEHDVDFFVIGGGSGGVRAARIAASHGARVALAESYRLGGTCVIRGCVPKKLLVYASRFPDAFEDASGFGWSLAETPTFSWPALIAAKGKEQAEENELGQVVPITRGGLEYFIDVMLELSLRADGFDTKRVATVVKSNSEDFPIGLELEEPTFGALMARLNDVPAAKPDIPEFLRLPDEPPVETGPTLDEVVRRAETYGLDRAKLLLAARSYHKVAALEQLSEAQRRDLLERMAEKFGPVSAPPKTPGKKNYAN